MVRPVRKKNIIAILLAVMLMVLAAAPSGFAQRRYRRPSKTKHIAVGTAAGAIGGALIGGRKGALIGAGAGAGTGYMIYRHKKNRRPR